jgi:hypothetical protein
MKLAAAGVIGVMLILSPGAGRLGTQTANAGNRSTSCSARVSRRREHTRLGL